MNFSEAERRNCRSLIEMAIAEDLGGGDITSEATIGRERTGQGELVFRQAGVVCGLEVVRAVLRRYDAELTLEAKAADGDRITAGVSVGRVVGNLRAMLAAERVMLNFLQRLSGIATATSHYVAAVRGTAAAICDTRKTAPGWRILEKYAVRCGGGTNHRVGLYDAALIKDNHLAGMGVGGLAAKLRAAVGRIRDIANAAFIEVEVDTLEQLQEVLTVDGVDMALLDNMTVEQMRQAVEMRNKVFCGSGRKVLLESSGGVTLETVRAIAETGVERISVGAITHSVRGVDIGFDIEAE
jgi:nicotinate-nucleotide pyrophosphorylase (carboxylating)